MAAVVDRSTSSPGAPRRRPARSCSEPRRSRAARDRRGDPRRRGGGALRELEARRAILVSEPGAWAAAGDAGRRAGGRRAGRSSGSCCPQGEDAKRLSVIEDAARELARLRAERREPLVALGGGALGDAAGVPRRDLASAASRSSRSRRRSSPRSTPRSAARPASTCPRARTSSARSTSPPRSCIDIAVLAALDGPAASGGPRRGGEDGRARRRAAVRDARGGGRGDRHGATGGVRERAVAEVVERAAWAKVEVVTADEREQGAAGSRSTSATRWGTRSRRPAGSASCSTARRWRTACEPPRGSARRWA